MNDADKTKDELLAEITRLRQKVKELESPPSIPLPVAQAIVNPHLQTQSSSPLVTQSEVRPGISACLTTEIALQASEQRFRTLSRFAPVGIYLTDAEGQCTYVNDKWCEITQFSPDQAIGAGWVEALHSDDRQQVFEEWKALVEGKREFDLEYRFQHPDGTIVWVSGQATTLRDEIGQVLGFIGTVSNISERKQIEVEREQAEAALRKKQDWLDLAQAAAQIGSFEWNIQTNVNIWSPELEVLYGLQPGEFGGTYEAWARWVHPDDLAKAEADVQQALETGELFTDWRIIRQDGSIHWIHARARVLYDDADQPLRMVGINVDVTEQKLAEAALRQSELRFRRIVDSNILGIFFGNLSGDITDANDAFLKMLGYSRQDLPLRWDHLTPPEHLDRTQQAVEELWSTGICTPFEKEFFCKDGGRVWVEIGSAIFEGTDGQVVCYVIDLSDRKQAEAALRRSEARSRRLIDSNLIGVLFADATGKITDANDAFLQIVGYSRQEFNNMSWRDITPPELRPSDERVLSEIKATGICTPFEKEYIRKDGSRVPILVGIAELWDTERERVCFVLDLTDRKQAEAALRQSELMFRTLADTMPQMVWTAQPDGRVEYFNQRWYDYTGTTLEQVQGQGWQVVLHPDDLQRTLTNWQHCCQTGNPYEIEYRLRCAVDGEYRWYLGRALPLRSQSGQIVEWFGSCTDIHDQKLVAEERAQALERERAARTELERASRIKDEFLAIVSHELRSPLNGILGWSRLLRTHTLPPETIEKALASIERNAQAQTQLIEDLLDISRIIRGNIRLNLRPTGLIPIIQTALDTVRPTASSKSIQIKTYLDPEVGFISGDPDRLQQIVWNLLSNAVKFTPEGGRVQVQLEQVAINQAGTSHCSLPNAQCSYAQITITDSGKGISPEFLPHVFDRFRQADATTSRTQGGLGLGLAIVQNLVELHGGTVSVTSDGEGLGSTFTVQFPLVTPQAGDQTLVGLSIQRQTHWETTLQLQGIKVLAVDDEADTREFLKTALEQFGASVTVVASAREALQRLQTEPVDVLLSDIGMPNEDGYSLIRKVRSLPVDQQGHIPAAALTAYAREDDRLQALNAGFQMHIPKPIEPFQLLAVVTKLAEKREQ